GARHDLFPHLEPGSRTPLYNFKNTTAFVSDERRRALGVGDDHWRPDITDHYRFALTRPEIDGVLCAPGTSVDIAALQRRLEAGPLDEEEQQYLIDLADLDRGRAVLD